MNRSSFLIELSKVLATGYLSASWIGKTNRVEVMDNIRESDKPGAIKLFLAGDVMTGRGIDQVLPHPSYPVLYEPYVKDAEEYVRLAERAHGSIPGKVSFDYIWGDAPDILNRINPDLRVINLETAVTRSDSRWEGKSIHYRMHPENIQVLQAGKIDVCILGNNHILDWGYEGLTETIQVLQKAGIMTAGAGENIEKASNPAIKESGAGRILIFSYGMPTSGVYPGWGATSGKAGVHLLPDLSVKSSDKMIRHIQSYYSEGDIVMVSIHWGGNWGYAIPAAQKKFAHRLVDSGLADIIHGHSSHHPKGIEVYNERLILYGCGDLINDYEGIAGREEYRGDLRLLYFPEVRDDGELTAMEIVPLKSRRFQLVLSDENDVRWIMEMLNRESRPFGVGLEESPDGRWMLKWENSGI